jgi:nickel transport protein
MNSHQQKRAVGHRWWWMTAAIWCLTMAPLAGVADGHGVNVFAWVADGTVYVQSKFSGGRNARNARIEVQSPDGKRLLEGNTAPDGTFSFPVPQPTALVIVLQAGPGHRAEWRLSEEEVRETGTATANTLHTVEEPVAAAELTPEAVVAIVDRALDKRLKPVMAMLADARDPKPGIRDVVGGIGYIVGLVGLVAYLRARQRRH